jgi:hypothetical protein
MDHKDPDHWLNETQIDALKHSAMASMIEKVLSKNPNACLFGGAVRDMILEAHQFGDKFATWREYDKEKCIVSNDLDFMVRSEEHFTSLKEFFADYYHCEVYESEYAEMEFAVFRVSVPLIIGTMMNNKLSIFVDLVYRKEEQRIDFDVNTLMYNHTKGFFVRSLPTESKLEYLLRFTKIVQHVQAKTAYFAKTSADVKWIKNRQERGFLMMKRGWRIVSDQDVFHFEVTSRGKPCHRCAALAEVFSQKIELCEDCWLDWMVGLDHKLDSSIVMNGGKMQGKVLFDSGVMTTTKPFFDSGVNGVIVNTNQ